MTNNQQFLTEYIELCRKYKTIIEPCGYSNLTISSFHSKKDFEITLQEHIKHYEKHIDRTIE